MNPRGDGIAAAVGLVRFAVMPPGHSGELLLGPGANRLSHSILARSVSKAKTPPELPPTNAKERNPRWLIRKSSSAGAVRAFPLRASLASCIFQRNRKSGPCTVAGEVFVLARTHEERWASDPTVVQSSARASLTSEGSVASKQRRRILKLSIGSVLNSGGRTPQPINHIATD